jgi:hypothetical protein
MYTARTMQFLTRCFQGLTTQDDERQVDRLADHFRDLMQSGIDALDRLQPHRLYLRCLSSDRLEICLLPENEPKPVFAIGSIEFDDLRFRPDADEARDLVIDLIIAAFKEQVNE